MESEEAIHHEQEPAKDVVVNQLTTSETVKNSDNEAEEINNINKNVLDKSDEIMPCLMENLAEDIKSEEKMETVAESNRIEDSFSKVDMKAEETLSELDNCGDTSKDLDDQSTKFEKSQPKEPNQGLPIPENSELVHVEGNIRNTVEEKGSNITEESKEVVRPTNRSHGTEVFTPFLNLEPTPTDSTSIPHESKVNDDTNIEPQTIQDITEKPTGDDFHQLLDEVEQEIHDDLEEIRNSLNYQNTSAEEIMEEIEMSYDSIDQINDPNQSIPNEHSVVKRRKKKKLTRKVVDPQKHPHTAPSLNRGASHASNLTEKSVDLTRNASSAPHSKKDTRPKTRSTNNVSGEMGCSTQPLTVYHSELMEGKYERGVVVSILVPEKYLRTTIPRDNTTNSNSRGNSPKHGKQPAFLGTVAPPNSMKFGRISRQPTTDSRISDLPDPLSETDNDDVHSMSSASSGGAHHHHSQSKLRQSVGSIQELRPNRKMKYFYIKVNDLITNREANYTVLLRDYRLFLEDVIHEYQTKEVEEFFQPYQLLWWKKHLSRILLIYDKPNGSLSVVIDKKLIKKYLQKKMEHYNWMKSHISSSYQQYEEGKEQVLDTLQVVHDSKTFPKNPLPSPKHANSQIEEDEGIVYSEYDESKLQYLPAEVLENSTDTHKKKMVDFSLISNTDELEDSTSSPVDKTTNSMRKSSRLILKQSQSQTEKRLPTADTNFQLNIETTGMEGSFDLQDPMTTTGTTMTRSQSSSYKARNSGMSKSLPDFTSIPTIHAVTSTDDPPGVLIKKKSDKKLLGSNTHHTAKSHHGPTAAEKKKIKSYNPRLSEKSVELLMVAYGRPKDYQPPPTASATPTTTDHIPPTTGSGSRHSKTMKNKATRSSVDSTASVKRSETHSSQVTTESLLSLVPSPYEGRSVQHSNKSSPKNRILSPKSSGHGSNKGSPKVRFSPAKPGSNQSQRLPSIQIAPVRSSSSPPITIFRITDPHSFSYQHQFTSMNPTTHTRERSPTNSPLELPAISHHSSMNSPPTTVQTSFDRPLSPLSPQVINEITQRIYDDANSPNAKQLPLGNGTLVIEDSMDNSFATSNVSIGDGREEIGELSTSQYHLQPIDRGSSPFELETHGLRGSAKVAADIIKKARRQVSSDVKFQVRRVSSTESKLLNSPFAKKLWIEPKDSNAIINKALKEPIPETVDAHGKEGVKHSEVSQHSHLKPVKRASMK